MSGSPAFHTGRLLLAFSTLVCVVLCAALWWKSSIRAEPQTAAQHADDSESTLAVTGDTQSRESHSAALPETDHSPTSKSPPHYASADGSEFPGQRREGHSTNQNTSHNSPRGTSRDRDASFGALAEFSPSPALSSETDPSETDDPFDPFGQGVPSDHSGSRLQLAMSTDAFGADFVSDSIAVENLESDAQRHDLPVTQPASITVHVDNAALVSEMASLVERFEDALAADRSQAIDADRQARQLKEQEAEFRREQQEHRQDEQIARIAGELDDLNQTMDTFRNDTTKVMADLMARVTENNERQFRFNSLLEQLTRQRTTGGYIWLSPHAPAWQSRMWWPSGNLETSTGPITQQFTQHTAYTQSQQPAGRVWIRNLSLPATWQTGASYDESATATWHVVESTEPLQAPAAPDSDWILELPPPVASPPQITVQQFEVEPAPAIDTASFVETTPEVTEQLWAPAAVDVSTPPPLEPPQSRTNYVLEDVNWPATPSARPFAEEAPRRRDVEIKPVVFEHTYEFSQTAALPGLPVLQKPCCQTAAATRCESCRQQSRVTRTAYQTSQGGKLAVPNRASTNNPRQVRVASHEEPSSGPGPRQHGVQSTRGNPWIPHFQAPAWTGRIPESRPVRAIRESKILNRVTSVFRQTPSDPIIE
ncbi:MAG: hypothetical protein R3C19_03640 [Planctomycetaceae bacterium]